MEPTIYKPSIYKGAGIYKNGAEGGGAVISGYLQITYKYPFVKIGQKFYTCKNLDELFNGINNGYNGTNPAAQRYYEGLFGRYYNPASIPIIDNYLQNNTDGWRVCTKNDIDDLQQNANAKDIIDFNFVTNNEMNNKFLLSIQPNGHYADASAQQVFDRCYLWSSTKDGEKNYYTQIISSGIETTSIYGTGNRYMPLRLCKDA